MNSKLLTLMLAGACTISAQADFNPIALTPGSFTADVIVEKTAQKSLGDYTTATMDNGTNNNGTTFYEKGYAPEWPWTGLPPAGTTFNALSDPTGHQFKMAPDYTTNNAILVGNQLRFTNGNLTLTTPAAFTAISILSAAGGAATLNYTIQYNGGGTQSGTLAVLDWTANTAPYAWWANGKVSLDDGTLSSLADPNANPGNRHLFYTDITLTDTVNTVTNIAFTYASGTRAYIWGLSGSTGAAFTPVTVTGFNRDMIVEKTAVRTGFYSGSTTETMDGNTGFNMGDTWYEQGFNRAALTTGIPQSGSTFTVGARTWTMPASYATNDAFFIGNGSSQTTGTSYLTATLTLNTPATFTNLSLFSGAGNGPVGINVTVHHSSGADENLSISVLDWFNTATGAEWTSNGRFNKSNLSRDNVNGNQVWLYHQDVGPIVNTAPVTSIDFAYASGGRASIFALSGSSSGGTYNPVAISGYNADVVVEKSLPVCPNALTNATTVTMDQGTNDVTINYNQANTFYEVGYYKAQPFSGFPAAGSTITSLSLTNNHYLMPASYTANDCIFVDVNHTSANMTIASPQTYSALSFLSCDGNGVATNQAIMQYADGTSETNTFLSQDWFGNTPVAYYANGRMDLKTRAINNDPGRAGTPNNPRLYEAQFALGNTGSPVTNILLRYLNPTNSATRVYIFAVSATAGAVPPIIASVSLAPATAVYEGTNLTFNAIVTGGTAPITYQWQKGTNGIYVNVVNGGRIAGATTTNMTITSAIQSDAADYRLVASNITGPVNSGILTLNRVISPLLDVTTPGDPISNVVGSPGAGVEGVSSLIDNTIQKALIFGSGTPFVGPVGFTVKTAAKGNTIVSVLRIYTANDTVGRDPADYLLEGSLDGSTFTTISSGALNLPAGRNTTLTDVPNPMTHNIQEVHFVNTAGYNYYRVSFNNVKDNPNNNIMQVGELDLLGIVNPNPPPTFTISPTDISANEGTTATFTSLATGPAPLTYQWYDVTAGDPGTLLVGQTNPNLNLPSVTAGQSGNRYRVVATNPNGSTTNPIPAVSGVQLTVNTGPVAISQDLQPGYLFYAGRTAQLAIGVTGSSPYYQWQSNGVNLVNGGRISGANSNILTISNIQVGDANLYQVFTSNTVSAPLTSSVATVFVTTAPNFHTNFISWQFVNIGGFGSYQAADNVLRMTDGQASEQRAAWFNYPLNIDGFKASFFYQDTSPNGADGFAFVIQNSPNGTNALGGSGGFLSYAGATSITNSVAVLFNIFNQSGITFGTNGVIGAFAPTAPVNVHAGDLIKIDLSYLGSVLNVVVSNTATADTFTTNYTVGSLAKTVGTNVAYVGVTAASGGISSIQEISYFQYIPVPIASAQTSGGSVNITWPASVGGYGIQSRTNLITGTWSDVSTAISQVGGNNQATIPATNGAAFYQLKLVPTP